MLGKLFGRRGGQSSATADSQGEAEIAERESYKGYELRAAPIQEGKVWRVAGSIVKTGTGDAEPQQFVRADTCASHDDAVEISMRKARQLADEQEAMGRRLD